jgi:hypothetical protein
MKLKNFESFFDNSHIENEVLGNAIAKLDDFFDKNIEKSVRVPILQLIEKNIVENNYPVLMSKLKMIQKDRRNLKAEIKRLGLEINKLMQNRKLEKKKLELLEHEILFQ